MAGQRSAHGPLMAALVAAVALHAGDGLADVTKAVCVDTNTKGQDLRRAGKLFAAREQFRKCSDRTCPAIVRDDCTKRLDELDAAQPTIAFEVKDSAGNDVPGAKVAVDGQPVETGAPGVAFDVDPGEHTFTFEAPGLPSTTKTLVIIEAVKARHEIVVVGRAETPGARSGPHEAPASSRTSGPPVLAWVAFGIGAAGLGVGLIGGLVADGKHSTLSGECNNTASTCAPQYGADLDSFHLWRTVSTVAYVVGGLGIAGGGLLWLTAPKTPPATTARIWIGPASAGVAGRF